MCQWLQLKSMLEVSVDDRIIEKRRVFIETWVFFDKNSMKKIFFDKKFQLKINVDSEFYSVIRAESEYLFEIFIASMVTE
jgi:hypothetical protein